MYRPFLGPTPGFVARCRQLTEARASFGWLADGSLMVQQQALRDFDQALRRWWNGSSGRPTWRKQAKSQGFRCVNLKAKHIRRLNRRWGTVHIPKVGEVRFRWTRAVPEAKSFRVKRDTLGRWHVAFAAIPPALDGPNDGSIVGIDRGVALSFALSDGSAYRVPAATNATRLHRRLSRAKRGSQRRKKARLRLARVQAKDAARRQDFTEKLSTQVATSYDLIRVEDLNVINMTRSARGSVEQPGKHVRQKASLNRAILGSGWGHFVRRLEHKAEGRVERVNPAFTSQRCSGCGHTAKESRESQSRFRCVACGYTDNADLNAAKNIAAGHAVTARGGVGKLSVPLNREPQLRLTA